MTCPSLADARSSPRDEAIAYLAGVVVGDGWLSSVLGLRCADLDFSQAFCDALLAAFGLIKTPKRDERGYWLVSVGARTGRFAILRDFRPGTDGQRAAWLRAFFDSDGNAQLTRNLKRGTNCFWRRVAIFKTNIDALRRASVELSALSIISRISKWSGGRGHLGTRQVYALKIAGNRENYARFGAIVGSSIRRKRETLASIQRSYAPDANASRRAAQLKGAATKTRRFNEVTLPALLLAIRRLPKAPTVRLCCELRGYHAARHRFTHAEIIRRATCVV